MAGVAWAASLLLCVQAAGKAGTPAPYGLRFELFKGEDNSGDTGVFRVAIDTTVGHETFSLLLDTGSGTLALCNGTTDHEGKKVPPAKPMPPAQQTGWKVTMSYGGCPSHGFQGSAHFGQVGIGELRADAIYVVMEQKEGERGNACGLPLSSSVGSTQLEGIFGFAGQFTNGPYYASSTCVDSSLDFKKCVFPSGCQPQSPEQNFASGFSDILLPFAKVQNTFSIAWSGHLGANSGTLSFGKVQGRRGTTASLYWTQSNYAQSNSWYYGLNISAFDAVVLSVVPPIVSSSPLLGARTSVRSNLKGVLVDTGSPAIGIPQATCDAVEGHFKQSEEPVTILISVQAAGGATKELRLPIHKRIWAGEFADLFDCEDPGNDGSWSNLVGLALWMWYDIVEFDIDHGVFEFFVRSDPLVLQEELLKLVQSDRGDSQAMFV
jgi:hypothetical protein